jgi:hypothetical protein
MIVHLFFWRRPRGDDDGCSSLLKALGNRLARTLRAARY